MESARTKYVGITVPRAIADQVRPYVTKGQYQSLAEFVKEAVRLRLEQLRASEATQKLESISS